MSWDRAHMKWYTFDKLHIIQQFIVKNKIAHLITISLIHIHYTHIIEFMLSICLFYNRLTFGKYFIYHQTTTKIECQKLQLWIEMQTKLVHGCGRRRRRYHHQFVNKWFRKLRSIYFNWYSCGGYMPKRYTLLICGALQF